MHDTQTHHSRWSRALSAALSAVALTALAAAPLAAQAQLKIGFMAELSGPQGPLGQDQYDALMLVVERNGGKLGGVPVQVLREDSSSSPTWPTRSSRS